MQQTGATNMAARVLVQGPVGGGGLLSKADVLKSL